MAYISSEIIQNTFCLLLQACSVWMPVTPVSQDACIKYVKGSHNWGQWFHPRKFATKKKYDHSTTEVLSDKSFLDAPDIDNEPDKYELLSWELQVRVAESQTPWRKHQSFIETLAFL